MREEPPGRMRNDDSIEASEDEQDRTPDGYLYTGYESDGATRIGDEQDHSEATEQLRELNEGRDHSDGQHSTRESRRDKKRIAQAMCSQLPISQYERKMVVSVMGDLDLTQFGHHREISRVVLGVVVVVVDERHRQRRVQASEVVSFSDEFKSLCKEQGVSMSDLTSIKQSARDALDTGRISIDPQTPKRDPALPGPSLPRDIPKKKWDNYPPKLWVDAARHWDSRSEKWKEAVPDEYRRIVDNLRKWKPWERVDEEIEKEAQALVNEMSK